MNEDKLQNNNQGLKVLRTYSSDMADAVKTNEMSVIKIALAEKEKKEKENLYKETSSPNNSKIFFAIGGIVLIIIAIIGSYFLFQKKKQNETPAPIVNNLETFIVYDSSSDIDVTNINNIVDLKSKIEQEEISGIKALFLKKKSGLFSETITSNDFLSLLNTSAPGALTRSLSDKYLLGEYQDPNSPTQENSPAIFLIFETTDYNQAYASMLDWEKTMLRDLSILFNLDNFSSTNSLSGKPWRDVVVNNKDVRVLYKEDGQGLLYYSFVNKNNFVITNNLEALKEVIKRLLIKNS